VSIASDRRTRLSAYTVAYAMLAAVFVVALWQRKIRSVYFAEPIRVAGSQPDRPDPRLDPNEAAWYDLARLPGIGPATAKRIVRYRQHMIEQMASTRPASESADRMIVFKRPEDLLAIKGIGPKTVQKIRPYLRFGPTQTPPRRADGGTGHHDR